jgi:hypothetical protein
MSFLEPISCGAFGRENPIIFAATEQLCRILQYNVLQPD